MTESVSKKLYISKNQSSTFIDFWVHEYDGDFAKLPIQEKMNNGTLVTLSNINLSKIIAAFVGPEKSDFSIDLPSNFMVR